MLLGLFLLLTFEISIQTEFTGEPLITNRILVQSVFVCVCVCGREREREREREIMYDDEVMLNVLGCRLTY